MFGQLQRAVLATHMLIGLLGIAPTRGTTNVFQCTSTLLTYIDLRMAGNHPCQKRDKHAVHSHGKGNSGFEPDTPRYWLPNGFVEVLQVSYQKG